MLITILLWLLLIYSAGWLALPVALRIWPDAPDGGLAAGRILFLAKSTLVVFWLGHAGVPIAWSGLTIILLAAVCLGLWWRERDFLKSTLKKKRRGIVVSQMLFLLSFLFFLSLRAFWPGTADGEKPMDMALFSSLARAERLPPANPYTSGERLTSYYYGGHLTAAMLTRAINSEPRWTYNLMIATVPALCFSALAMLCAQVMGSLLRGSLAAFCVLGLGTLEPLRRIAPQFFGETLHPWPYFATSRVIPNTINEYPFFTFAFGDLHAHFLAMPLAVVAISIAWSLATSASRQLATSPSKVLLFGASAVVLAALIITNSWDFPVYVILLILCATAVSAKRTVWMIAAPIAALALASPFLLRLETAARPPQLLLEPGSEVAPWLFLWCPILAPWLLILMANFLRRKDKSTLVILLVAAIALAFANGYAVLIWLLATLLATARLAWTTEDVRLQWMARLAVCGLLALLWSETTWSGFLSPPHHRQDTVFKFGLQAWYLLGTATACAVALEWKKISIPLRVIFLLPLPIMIWSSLSVVRGRTQIFGEFVGLDAWSHLTPPQRSAAQWLNDRAKDGDTILEAEKYEGGDYSEFSRFTHATGIPTVIGPAAHSFQWGASWDEVGTRKLDVRQWYLASDESERRKLLERYSPRWIIVGDLERAEYGTQATSSIADQFDTAAQFGEGAEAVTIFEAGT